jgi:two-component system chemotaxis response regulator CheY
MRILIVEDDFVSRRVMQEYLTPFGVCEIAVSGPEAIEAFRVAWREGHPYDLIYLDIMIPDKDGLTVLREIRIIEAGMGISGLKGVKVIMTTAINEPRTIMEAFQERCEAYLVKPVNRTKLVDNLKALGLA